MHRLIALFLALVLVAAACGSDDGGGDGSAAPATDGAPSAAGDDGASVDGEAPMVGDHWHAAYGIFVCDNFLGPIPDQTDPEGIHTHGDGIIHIHPFGPSASGANATMGKFFDAVSIDLDDLGLSGDGGSLTVEDAVCGDQPVEFTIHRWAIEDFDQPATVYDSDLADVRFTEDLELFTLAFAPPGTEIPIPPSVPFLTQITDVDPEDLPQLPEGLEFPSVEFVDPPPPGQRSEETVCPEEDGSSPRTTSFSQPPPQCIDPSATYTATFVTNLGDVVVELDTVNTPDTVNNFVVLARYGYYDDTSIFRTAPSIAIVQGGAPNTNSPADPGPGYTIEDEGDGFTYQPGDLAMARTPAPNSASSQWFFSAGPATANLNGEPGNPDGSGRGTYVVFGRTIEGLDILEEILSLHVDDPALNGGGPSEAVIVEQVLIEES